ncbi:MAG TPA: carbon-nitrogen hydrolase [Terriglobales bacterium]|nr:carbon-nitrogen hydrolase [Terriglobales bacterium]
MPRKIKIALLQAKVTADPAANLASTLAQIEQAAKEGAQLVCTQELFRSRYFCQREDHANFALAESIPGPTTDALCAAARKSGVVLVASLFERRAAGIYHNTAVVIDAGGTLLGSYRKMHIPDDPLYHEKFYFTPGDLGFRTFKTAVGTLGVLVCWDQWFPEAARLTALAGAEILVYPTAIGWHPAEKAEWGARQLDSWQTIQRSHAVANGVFVAVPNRVGLEKDQGTDGGPEGYQGIEFWGHSFIADPSGQVLAKAGASNPAIVTAEVDLDLVEQTRQHWPFLRDRRVDAYQDLTRRLRD